MKFANQCIQFVCILNFPVFIAPKFHNPIRELICNPRKRFYQQMLTLLNFIQSSYIRDYIIFVFSISYCGTKFPIHTIFV